MKLRHILIYDQTNFDLAANRVAVDQNGHPIIWEVEHAQHYAQAPLTRENSTPRVLYSFWVTYLEAEDPQVEENIHGSCGNCRWEGEGPNVTYRDNRKDFYCPNCGKWIGFRNLRKDNDEQAEQA